MKIIIPARFGSKGLPLKNRLLFKYTADIIPNNLISETIVTTDDPEIKKMAKEYGFEVVDRPKNLAEDNTSIRDVIMHTINEKHIQHNSFIVMLYLTYPKRTWADIESATDFLLQYYEKNLSDSLLCKKSIKSSPYLYMEERGHSGVYGKQIIPHDLYRRQDYPTCFEISHYISIFKASSIYKLNRNMYCDSTVFYQIPDTIDVDTENDLIKFKNES
jgi:CMP-N-acetylneuraminic acid synthetase